MRVRVGRGCGTRAPRAESDVAIIVITLFSVRDADRRGRAERPYHHGLMSVEWAADQSAARG